VEGGVLGFRGNGYLRWENPPEGAKNLQGYSRHTEEHIWPLGFTGFHRKLELTHKGWKRGHHWAESERRERGEGKAAHQREKGRVQAQGRRRIAAGEWRSPARVEIAWTREQRLARGENEPGLGLRQRRIF
jgi:hypothetical protein